MKIIELKVNFANESKTNKTEKKGRNTVNSLKVGQWYTLS